MIEREKVADDSEKEWEARLRHELATVGGGCIMHELLGHGFDASELRMVWIGRKL
jgi:hypothetical protein